MTELQNTTERLARWMRCAARILTLVWAVCWIAFVGVMALLNRFAVLRLSNVISVPDWICGGLGAVVVALALACLLAVPGWVAIAIAGRRAAAGGAVLVAEGVLLLAASVSSLVLPDPWTTLQGDWAVHTGDVLGSLVLLVLGGLALFAGTLCLANWWKSRKRVCQAWSWKDPRWVAAVPVAIGLALGLPLSYIVRVSTMLAQFLVFCTFNECIL